jgi:hypothetical protein
MEKLGVAKRRFKWEGVHRLESDTPHMHFRNPIIRSCDMFSEGIILQGPDVWRDIVGTNGRCWALVIFI